MTSMQPPDGSSTTSNVKVTIVCHVQYLDRQQWVWSRPHHQQTHTASDSVWDAFCKAHPKAIQFRDKPLKSLEELDCIFSGKSATGKYAQSSGPVTPSQRRDIELSEASEDDGGKAISSLA